VATNHSIFKGIQVCRSMLVALVMLAGLFGLPTAVNASWDKTFIEGVNGYGNNSWIDFYSSAYLFNAPTNSRLPAEAVYDNHGACVASNGNNWWCFNSRQLAQLPNDRLAFGQCASTSNTNIGPPSFYEKTVSVPQGEYANISLSGGDDRTLKFTSPEGIYKMKTLSATSGRLELSSGQYWIDTLTISNGVVLVFPTTGTVTFFIKNDYRHQNLNLINAAERFVIYSYGNFTLNGGAYLNAYVVAEGTATLEGSASLTGAITSNQVRLNGGSSVVFADTVVNVTTVPNCTIPAPPAAFHLQYGQSQPLGDRTGTVVFDKAFDAAVTPLIFAMATITDTSTNGDGSAAVFVSNITKDGFSWTQKESPSPANRYIASLPMPDVHWFAVSPGTHTLSNGSQLIAGSVAINQALIGSNSPYTKVSLPSSQNVVLNQLQTQTNNCWLTSTSQLVSGGIELGLDASEVRASNSRCQPGNLANSQLQAETVAYLAVKSSAGTLNLGGQNVKFEFANNQTHASGSVIDLSNQCNYLTSLTGFEKPPIFIAAKTSRRGGDGGWLRRCKLSSSQVSMVVDEDTYLDSNRWHVWESYSFVAFEKKVDSLTCFTDDFNRTDIGDDWAYKVLGTSLPPSIVNSRLRFTSATGNQATASTYQRLFPAADNLVEIEFDYFAWSSQSGTGADGIAISLSDASITPQPGSFGGALGYAQRDNGTPGFAGGWLGIALDEYGNFSNDNEGKKEGPGFRPQAVAIRGSAGTNYRYLTGTNANLNPWIDVRSTANAAPNHRYKIIVDSRVAGTAMVSVLRDTQNRGNPADYVTLIAPFNALSVAGQAPVPEKLYVSITGSTGGSNNNHEMDNFKVCALKSEPVGAQVHHFEFDYTSSPLTCKAEVMTLRACKNALCDLFTDPVQASLSPHPITNGAWSFAGAATNVINFTNGLAQVSLRHNVTTPITIGVTASNPSTIAGSNTLCRRGGGALLPESCSLSFAESGFIFDVPDKLANKPTGNISISAVKKSDSTLQCVPTFASTTKNVGFWSTYVEPTTAISGQSISVNATAVGKQSSAATTLALAFDAEGKVNINVNYPDAGKMQLDAKYTGTGDEQGLILLGSDQFVSFPVGLCVKAKDSNASCSAGNASCSVYKKAAEAFELIIQGKAWQRDGDNDYCDNLNTPNYAHNDIALGHSIVAPLGGALGALGNVKYNHLTEATSSNTVSQSVPEVGVFKFTATQPASYLGASYCSVLSLGTNCTMPNYVSSSIGRFVPASFSVRNPLVTASCGIFSYMDQGFSVSYVLDAWNVNNDKTLNYAGTFAKATMSFAGEDNNAGVDLSSRLSLSAIANANWLAGSVNISHPQQVLFARLAPPLQDGPYESLMIGLKVQDNDGDYAKVVSDMHAGSTDLPCGALCDAKSLATATKLRHGRVTMDNTYGPESETLLMPTYAQYWNGNSWIINGDDSCTSVTPGLDNREVYLPVIETGQGMARGQSTPNTTAGELTLTWRNTGTNFYRGQVTAPLVVAPWLKWYWNWDTLSPNNLADPRASAFFGRYRGHDRIIYWRETE
jgi:MSHA biogenesis protein MshQ